ncbi:MAG: BamA/TamA family outer membrane protein [Bacteriovoracaceae bacterium]|nr:BamA/TamA family outer membrane protein [Bacteroidota bacterium]
MQRIVTLISAVLMFVSVSAAQDTDVEDRIDQTTNSFEKLVDDVVDHIESQMDYIVEKRSNNVEYRNDIDEQERDNKNAKISSDAVTYNGNTEIVDKDTVMGDLVVKNGTLIVRGTVNGDILVVNGDIELKRTSRINGNVRAMNGGISKEDGAYVEGFTEQSSTTPANKYRRKTTYRTKYSYSFKPYFWNSENVFDDNFLFRYNRVEGLFFGIGSEKKFYWDGSKAISGYGSFGYGVTSHKWRIQMGLGRQFAVSDETLYEIGGEAHSLTDTKDEWIMSLSENNLAALFFREDFRDYYQREGFSLHSSRYTKDMDMSMMIDVRYLNDRYATMHTGARWAVFGGNTFRGNPQVNIGTMKSISLSAGISTVEKYRFHTEGWNLYARGEYGGNELGGDFDFSQAIIDLRRFQPLSDDDQINLRLRAGMLEGNTIAQKDFQLGGANTLPAYGFKEFSGNRMLLANLEYRLSGELIDEIFFFPNSLSVIAFGNAGAVTTVNTKWAVYEGLTSFKSSQVRSDYGFAIAWHDGDARLGFAWRTDKQAPVAIFFRLNKAF